MQSDILAIWPQKKCPDSPYHYLFKFCQEITEQQSNHQYSKTYHTVQRAQHAGRIACLAIGYGMGWCAIAVRSVAAALYRYAHGGRVAQAPKTGSCRCPSLQRDALFAERQGGTLFCTALSCASLACVWLGTHV